MWNKIKQNWKTYLLLILSALFGADQAEEFGLLAPATQEEAPASYEAASVDTWTVVADFTIERKAGGGAIPEFTYLDGLGRETVFVSSAGEPTGKDAIYAFYGPDPPPGIRAEVVRLIPPRKKKREEPAEEPAEK